MTKTENAAAEAADAFLEAYFDTARRAEPDPAPQFLDAVLRDAFAQQSLIMQQRVNRSAPRPGFWQNILNALGGWGSVAGLTTATLVGAWLGFSQPFALSGIGAGVLETTLLGSTEEVQQVDLLPDFDNFLTEG